MRIENSFEEWGVKVPGAKRVWSKGRGFYGKRHAQQEVAGILHNANLPNTGQPLTGKVVKRQVIEIRETTEWIEDE